MKFKTPEYGTEIVEFGLKRNDSPETWFYVGRDKDGNVYKLNKMYTVDYHFAKNELIYMRDFLIDNKYLFLKANTKFVWIMDDDGREDRMESFRDGWYYVKEIL